MTHGPKPPQTISDCKVKQVYPRLPLRVHSAGLKGLAGSGSGDPPRSGPGARRTARGSEWSPHRLLFRPESELSSEAWTRLESAARRHGRSVEEILLGAIEAT